MYDYTYYDYGYDYGYQAASGLAAGMLIFGIIMWLIGIAVSVITIISMWKIFVKAGKPGWAAIIPVYNIIVMLEISELPMWYLALYFVPGANIYAMIKTYIEVAHKFGKSTGFGVGMALLSPVFLTMLAFNKNTRFNSVENNDGQTYQQPTQQIQPQTMYQQSVQTVSPTVPVNTVLETQVQSTVSEQPVVSFQDEIVPPIGPGLPGSDIQVTPVEQLPVQKNIDQSSNQPISTAFCANCGSPLIPNTKFCTNCGKQI